MLGYGTGGRLLFGDDPMNCVNKKAQNNVTHLLSIAVH